MLLYRSFGLDCVFYFMFTICMPFVVANCMRVRVRALSDQYKLLISYSNSLSFSHTHTHSLFPPHSHWCKVKRPCGTFMLRCENMQWIFFSIHHTHIAFCKQVFFWPFFSFLYFSFLCLSFFVTSSFFFDKFSNGNFFRQYIGFLINVHCECCAYCCLCFCVHINKTNLTKSTSKKPVRVQMCAGWFDLLKLLTRCAMHACNCSDDLIKKI